ncbi:MAG: ATP-binding cassette domain-containing protein [Thiotrichales bacterium]
MIKIENVSKHYGSTVALDQVDLAIPRGKTTILLGQSGSGKSTLLRIINGLIAPDGGGQVLFEGTPVTPANSLQLRQRMGYVTQEGGLFPHLSAEQNITLMADFLGWSDSRCKNRVAELAELAHLSITLLERYPHQLSGGQRQRISLMRALMLDPKLLLLDEPLGALDPMIRSELQTDLKNIFNQLGKTTVIVTHDIGEAGFLGDHIVLLRDGAIVQQGTLPELVQQPADSFVTDFINAQRSPLDTLSGAVA